MEENITAVKILGEEFRISCPPEEKEQVINAAAFLDSSTSRTASGTAVDLIPCSAATSRLTIPRILSINSN